MLMTRVIISDGDYVTDVYEIPTSKIFRKDGQFVSFIRKPIFTASQYPQMSVKIESFNDE